MLGWFFFSAILSEWDPPTPEVWVGLRLWYAYVFQTKFLLINSVRFYSIDYLKGSYNKYVFGEGHMSFPCPLLLTSIHFSIQGLFSHVACQCFPEQLGTKRVTSMTWREWAWISVPCGVVTALDVGLSNLSLVKISLTFYTMVKSFKQILDKSKLVLNNPVNSHHGEMYQTNTRLV